MCASAKNVNIKEIMVNSATKEKKGKSENCDIAKRLKVHLSSVERFFKEYHQTGLPRNIGNYLRFFIPKFGFIEQIHV